MSGVIGTLKLCLQDIHVCDLVQGRKMWCIGLWRSPSVFENMPQSSSNVHQYSSLAVLFVATLTLCDCRSTDTVICTPSCPACRGVMIFYR